jgi:glyceraldehyde-3-phosphate dehydrogenase (ferredoxin)
MGTFYANYKNNVNLPMYDWLNILKNIDLSQRIEKLLSNYTPSFKTCGESCPAICKKIEDNTKLDYEPVNALGPFLGIFDRSKIKEYINLVDSLGFDAIYLGHILAGYLEKEGILNPEVETDIDLKEIISKLNINKVRNSEIRDYVFYIPFGKDFDMTPNFYYSLGFFLPTPIPGTYLTDYSKNATYESILDRAIKEYQLNNYTICRFHRKWIEKLLDYENVLEKIKILYEYRKLGKAEPVYWESEKALKVVSTLGNPEELWNNWIEFISSR